MRLTAGAALLFLVPGLLAGAAPDLPPITVHRASGPIVVNGDLSDPGWKDAAVIGEFWETQPGDNASPGRHDGLHYVRCEVPLHRDRRP